MTTIIIEWEYIKGIPHAHFPEPFPMDEAEFSAFQAVFARLGYHPTGTDTLMSAETTNAPRELSEALEALGYSTYHRGTVPPAIRGE